MGVGNSAVHLRCGRMTLINRPGSLARFGDAASPPKNRQVALWRNSTLPFRIFRRHTEKLREFCQTPKRVMQGQCHEIRL
jgi:hypothetical protein